MYWLPPQAHTKKPPEHIPGWNLPHVTNIRDVLSGRVTAGERVLMVGYDTQVIETAEWLAERGRKVFLVSAAPVQAWEDPWAALANDKKRLYRPPYPDGLCQR